MDYTKTTWVDGTTPVNASNLNNIESGIAGAADEINGISDNLSYTNVIVSRPTSDDGLDDGIEIGGTWSCRLCKWGNVVNLRLNANGTITSGGNFKTLITLPDGYAPANGSIINSYCGQNGTPMGMQIATDGVVSVYSYTGTSGTEFIFRQNLTWVIR